MLKMSGEQLLQKYTPPQKALDYMSQMHVDAEQLPDPLKISKTILFGKEEHEIIPLLFPEPVRSEVKKVDLSTYLVVLKEVPFSYAIPSLFDELNSHRREDEPATSFDMVLKKSHKHFAAYAGLCRYPYPNDSRRLSGMEAYYIDNEHFRNDPDLIAQDIARRGEKLIEQYPALISKLSSGQPLSLDDMHKQNKMIAWTLNDFRDISRGNPAAEDYNYQTHSLAENLPLPLQEVFYYQYGENLFELYVMVQARLNKAHGALEFPQVPLSERGRGGKAMDDLLMGGQPIIRQLDSEYSAIYNGISTYGLLDTPLIPYDLTR